jgi:ubiquinone/menaquinone biosynthesis C-methylase UbiE
MRRTEQKSRQAIDATSISNPFTTPQVVSYYEAWYETTGKRADRLEKALLEQLLTDFPDSSTILDAGCGTCHFARWFETLGFCATGLDVSWPMLAEAVELGGSPCVNGNVLNLPFQDHSFDLVNFVTTLEFVANPGRALAEAVRVARKGLLLGVLNRKSLLAWRMSRSGKAWWANARLFTPAELVEMINRVTTPETVKVAWRTTLWPVWSGNLALPWGGFIGMSVRFANSCKGARNGINHG